MLFQRWTALVVLAAGLAVGAGLSAAVRLQTLFLSGSPAPAGLPFASFGRAAVNARGTVCFLAGWDGRRRRPEGLYLRRGDEVLPVVRAGDPVPRTTFRAVPPGARFSFPPEYPDEFSAFALNDRDEVAFITRQGLFLYTSGGLRPVARVGDGLPGAADEQWEELLAVSLNNRGAVAFVAATRSVLDGERHEGVYQSEGGAPKILLFEGDPLPELNDELAGFDDIAVNDQGQVAVLARVGVEERPAILLRSDSETRVLAIQDGPAPGGVWIGLAGVALNNAGEVAFQGQVAADGVDRTGIFRASGGAVTPVAMPGQAIAGGAPGAAGSGMTLGEHPGRPVLDDAGIVAFVADLAGRGGAQALLRADGGVLTALAVEGQEAPGGLSGTVTRLSGLNRGSLGPAGLVCSLALTGGPVGDAVMRYSVARAPEVVMTSGAPLPPGGALTTADSDSDDGEVEAKISPGGELVLAADAGGYGRALFRAGAEGPELLTPLGQDPTAGPAVRSVTSWGMNATGQIAYLGVVDEAGRDTAVFSLTTGKRQAPALVAATRMPLPGDYGGRERVITHLEPPALDGRGRIYFAALASDAQAAAPSMPAAYLLRAAGSQRELLAVEGQRIPGVGVLAGSSTGGGVGAGPGAFRELQVNAAGQALFLNGYRDEHTGALVPAGLFLLSGGEIRAVAVAGQKAPLPGGPTYAAFASPRLSEGGAVVFEATVVGARQKPRVGLFRLRGAETQPVAVAGDPVPWLDGARYQSVSAPAINSAGDVAFSAVIDGPPATAPSAAVFVARETALNLVLADGAPLEENGVAALRLDPRFPAAPLSLRDDGFLLVAAHLRDSAAPAGLFLIPPRG